MILLLSVILYIKCCNILQILFEILPKMQSKLSEKCWKSKGYETISGKMSIHCILNGYMYLAIIYL